MWVRSELKDKAKTALKLNYWKAVLTSLILALITGGGGSSSSSSNAAATQTASSASQGNPLSSLSSANIAAIAAFISAMFIFIIIFIIVMLALSIFVFYPLYVGAHRFFLFCDRENASLGALGFSFSHGYGNTIKTIFLSQLYIFLWSLLLIIPGIIKAYEYRMIPYILAENPQLPTKEVFALSKKMMYGDKANAFLLDLSFIGWQFLGLLTCCVLSIFYVNPYYYLTCAELYKELKKKIGGASSTAGFDPGSQYTPEHNPYI